jgi:hypothetical protein
VKRAALLGTAAAVYVLAAWAVAPGFYDGIQTTPPPYRWVCPPPGLAEGNLPPQPGHVDINVINAVSDADSAFSADSQGSQIAIGFLPGAFDAVGKSSIAVEIVPVLPCPEATGIDFATNAYLITATAQLVKSANLDLRYSNVVPAPSFVYFASSPYGPWVSIGAAPTAQFYTIDTTTRNLGYFAAGYPANAINHVAASQLLPIAVAILILGVVIAGIPLAVLRRRRAAAGIDDSDETDDC